MPVAPRVRVVRGSDAPVQARAAHVDRARAHHRRDRVPAEAIPVAGALLERDRSRRWSRAGSSTPRRPPTAARRPRLRHAVAAFRAPAGARSPRSSPRACSPFAAAGAARHGGSPTSICSAPTADDASSRRSRCSASTRSASWSSLPVTFVPFHVLLERVPSGAAFAASWNAFALQHAAAARVYAAASLVLLAFGMLTMGLGLVLALPLWAASSYAAWKDVFGVRDAHVAADASASRRRPEREVCERPVATSRRPRRRVTRAARRAAPAPRDDRLDRVRVALHERLDRAVAPIAHPAGDAACRARRRPCA